MPAGRVWRSQFVRGACLLLLGAGAAPSARAGEIWNGASLTDSKWSTADNWNPIGSPVNDGSANVMMLGPDRPDSLVDLPWSVRSMQFPSGAIGFSITGSTLSIGDGGISNTSGVTQRIANNISLISAQTWDVSSDLTAGGAISGAFGLTKIGEGILTLSGATANSYT